MPVPSSVLQWHLITCEYPPDVGGVADHTAAFARELARTGDDVQVWSAGHGPASESIDGVEVHRSLGGFSRDDLDRADHALNSYPSPRHLVVQWVPHGYGMRSMNIFFCRWLLRRRRFGDVVELVIHEPSMPWDSLRHGLPAVTHRLMLMVLLRAATRVWMVIPGWEARVRPFAMGRRIPFHWLPILTGIDMMSDRDGSRVFRDRFGDSIRLIAGHLSMAARSGDGMLEAALNRISTDPSVGVLLIGKNSEALRKDLIRRTPELETRVQATGMLDSHNLSLALQTCDLMLQPYPDGVSSRRTSSVNALRHGLALATTSGHLTESFWREAGIPLTPAGSRAAFAESVATLLKDDGLRAEASRASARLFEQTFLPSRIVADFRSIAGATADSPSGDDV